MAGRYRAAQAMIARLPDDALTPTLRVIDAASLAAVGRAEDATSATAAALAADPAVAIAGVTGAPGWGEAERRRLAEAMRLAGFPPCAGPAERRGHRAALRLPECTAQARGARAARIRLMRRRVRGIWRHGREPASLARGGRRADRGGGAPRAGRSR